MRTSEKLDSLPGYPFAGVAEAQKKLREEGVDVINLYLDPANHRMPDVPKELTSIVETLLPPADLPGAPRGLVSFLQFEDPEPMVSILQSCCFEMERKGTGYLSALESGLRRSRRLKRK